MSRHRSDPGRAGPIAVSLVVAAVVVILGGVGGYSLYRGLSSASSEVPGEPVPSKVELKASTTAPLRVRAPDMVCKLTLLDLEGNVLEPPREIEPGVELKFAYKEFQGTVCLGAEVYVNGVKQAPTPGPSGESGSFRS